MRITLTPAARRITIAALAAHKALAQNAAAISKRLHVDESPLLTTIGANDYLKSILADIPTGENTVRTLEVPDLVVKTWRSVLSVWQKGVTLRSEQLTLLEVRPDRTAPEAEANKLLDQLNEKLGEPRLGLEALTVESYTKPNKADVKEAAVDAGLVPPVVIKAPETPLKPDVEARSGKDAAAGEKDDDGWDEGPPPATVKATTQRARNAAGAGVAAH